MKIGLFSSEDNCPIIFTDKIIGLDSSQQKAGNLSPNHVGQSSLCYWNQDSRMCSNLLMQGGQLLCKDNQMAI